MARRLKAELIVYPDGGHNLRLQDPKWTNQKLLLHFKEAADVVIDEDEDLSLKHVDSLESIKSAEEADLTFDRTAIMSDPLEKVWIDYF